MHRPSLTPGAVLIIVLSVVLSACASDGPTRNTGDTPSAPPAPAGAQGQAPTLVLSADTICLTTTAGTDPRPDDVRITLSDGSVVAGLIASVTHEAGQPAGWLATSFDRDTTPARLWLTGTVGTLATGEYRAQVTVAAPGASPRVITVVLKVHPVNTRALVVKDRSNFFGDLAPGGGVVEGPGISCRSGFGDCVEYFPVGAVVTLTASTDSTSALFRWTDACENTPISSPCTLTITDSTTAGAWFVLRTFGTKLTLTGTGATGGVLMNASPYMPRYCMLIDGTGGVCDVAGPIDGNKGMALTAEPHFGSRFLGWGGNCSGAAPTCILGRNPGGTYDVTAAFERDPAIGNVLKVSPAAPAIGSLHGSITGGGVDCRIDDGVVSGTCEVELPVGSTVTLIGTADRPIEFIWSWQFQLTTPAGPSCPQSGQPAACTITLNGPRALTLSFFSPRSP